MATNFPENLDTLTNPNANDPLSNPSHSQQHINLNDAVEAIQTKVGIDGSEDPNSLDFKVNQVESQLANLGNQTDTTIELLGLQGNNDLTITGIENKTTIDTFPASVYRTIKYDVQITRGSEYYYSTFNILNEGSTINIAEIGILSNTNDVLANTTFEVNSGIIGLCVTPVSSAVTVRYIRTALKS